MVAMRRSESQRRRTGTARGILVAVHAGPPSGAEGSRQLARSRMISVGSVWWARTTTLRKNVYGYYSTWPQPRGLGQPWLLLEAVWAALTGGGFFFIPGLGAVVIAVRWRAGWWRRWRRAPW